MKLIMTENRLGQTTKWDIAEELGYELAFSDYDGLSTKEIESNLMIESNGVAVVTADSRFLKFVRNNGIFTLDDVFIYRNYEFKNIKDTTLRKLRNAHSLVKLYDAREFEF